MLLAEIMTNFPFYFWTSQFEKIDYIIILELLVADGGPVRVSPNCLIHINIVFAWIVFK